MPAPFTLQPLLELARNRADAAARRVGALNLEQRQADHMLALLEQYRRDYQSRFQESAREGLDPAGWRNFQDFLAKLDQAIAQQREVVKQWQHRVRDGVRTWHAEQKKAMSFDKLAQRHRTGELKRAEKREQREHDELACASSARAK